jgi:hypothetical protein
MLLFLLKVQSTFMSFVMQVMALKKMVEEKNYRYLKYAEITLFRKRDNSGC